MENERLRDRISQLRARQQQKQNPGQQQGANSAHASTSTSTSTSTSPLRYPPSGISDSFPSSSSRSYPHHHHQQQRYTILQPTVPPTSSIASPLARKSTGKQAGPSNLYGGPYEDMLPSPVNIRFDTSVFDGSGGNDPSSGGNIGGGDDDASGLGDMPRKKVCSSPNVYFISILICHPVSNFS